MRTQLLTLDHLVQLMDPTLYLHLQSADSTNFFFFFRMLLVWYKREFEWTDVQRLWESLWTDYLSSNFHLFMALAILEKHRDVIMEHLKHFDEVLKYGMFIFCVAWAVKIWRKTNELRQSTNYRTQSTSLPPSFALKPSFAALSAPSKQSTSGIIFPLLLSASVSQRISHLHQIPALLAPPQQLRGGDDPVVVQGSMRERNGKLKRRSSVPNLGNC